MRKLRESAFEHFEVIVVVMLVCGAAFTVLAANDKIAFLNFFYVPTLVAAYYLGRRRGVLTGMVAVLLIALYAILDPQRFAGPDSNMPGIGVYLWGAFLIVTAYVVGSLYDAKEHHLADLRQAYEGILEILAKFIDTVDGYTQDHSVRVSDLSAKIAQQMRLPAHETENVRVAGLLHDVGKVDISIEVLRKAAELTNDEWEIIKTHAAKGSALLEPVGGLLKDVLPIVMNHHEFYDGSGYHGQSGDEIPLGARIVAVADAYDSMVTDRPYRTGRSSWEARLEIENYSGRQFDPVVVAAFTAVMKSEFEYDWSGRPVTQTRLSRTGA